MSHRAMMHLTPIVTLAEVIQTGIQLTGQIMEYRQARAALALEAQHLQQESLHVQQNIAAQLKKDLAALHEMGKANHLTLAMTQQLIDLLQRRIEDCITQTHMVTTLLSQPMINTDHRQFLFSKWTDLITWQRELGQQQHQLTHKIMDNNTSFLYAVSVGVKPAINVYSVED
jgi:hypothetical protein